MSKTTITTARTGNDVNIDFATKKVTIPVANHDDTLSCQRAYPASKGHTDHEQWPQNGTHYITLKKTIIALTEDQANKFNDAISEYIKLKLISDQRALDAIIPGLSLLQKASNDLDNYHYKFNKATEDEHNDGVNMPAHPGNSLSELCKEYPTAALYLKAESYSFASHSSKASAGDKAKKLLASGGGITEAESILDNWLPERAIWN